MKLAQARMKLASLEVGGAPDRPIEVTSASVVEPHAASMPCAACGAPGVRVEEHRAETVARVPLRIASVKCLRCGVVRDVWFRIGGPAPS